MKIILTVRVDSFEKSKLSPLLLLNEGKLCAVRCQVNHNGHRSCDNKKPGAFKNSRADGNIDSHIRMQCSKCLARCYIHSVFIMPLRGIFVKLLVFIVCEK